MLSQGQEAQPQLTDGFCPTDDRHSSRQGAKHHKQGPLTKSHLARSDSKFLCFEGLRRCLLVGGGAVAAFTAVRGDILCSQADTLHSLYGVPPVYYESSLVKALSI